MTLSMSELGLGRDARFLRLSGGRASVVRRPVARRSGMSGLGAGDECGAQPTLASGEYAQCCPNVGWVVYSLGESQYGLCERAAAAAGLTTGSTASALPTDPLERVNELRRRLDERRSMSDEQRFEQQKQELQLRFVASQMQAVQAAEAARMQAERDAETRRLLNEAKAREAKIQSERTKQLLLVGGLALLGAKAFKLI